jgi:FAD/FMN-containing dehydrogenase
MSGLPGGLVERFIAVVGSRNALTGGDELSRYTEENRHIFTGVTPLVLKPGATGEVAAIMRLANETGTAIVPQGGNTGHAAGAQPDDSGRQVVVSLERMNTVREIDIAGNTMIVEAGVVLETIQRIADDQDRLFPLSLASQGSCQIGGNISTNAGGIAVLSYGNTRDMVLGLEVVTPAGDIWNGLRRLKKDNTGYDLRDLFIGAEGTLGIVTAAVVKLFAKPRGRVAAFAGLAAPEDCLALLQRAQRIAGKSLTGYEFMPRIGVESVAAQFDGMKNPLTDWHDWFVLLEISSSSSEQDAHSQAEHILQEALEAGNISDAAISHSETQRQALWEIRELLPASQKALGGSIKHDISVPVHLVPDFLKRAGPLVHRIEPQARIFAFGHLGDGNIHYNVSQPNGAAEDWYVTMREAINDPVHALVTEMGGSISAEHGIGKLKRDLLARTKSEVELEMMRAIKRALDPNHIMNPGKVI